MLPIVRGERDEMYKTSTAISCHFYKFYSELYIKPENVLRSF